MSLYQINKALLAGARHETGNKDFSFHNLEEKPTRSLRTGGVFPHPDILKLTDGTFYVPTYADLVRGLKYLPQGVDARALTQCVVWWLSHQELELNVLHTGELFRVLRIPLRKIGPMNLDRIMLGEWRGRRSLSEVRVADYKGRDEDEVEELHVPNAGFNFIFTAPLLALAKLEVECLREVLGGKEGEASV